MTTLHTPCADIQIEAESSARLAYEYRNCHDKDTLNALRAELERRDGLREAALESVGRLRAWLRNYGHEKQPAFVADLEVVLAAVVR